MTLETAAELTSRDITYKRKFRRWTSVSCVRAFSARRFATSMLLPRVLKKMLYNLAYLLHALEGARRVDPNEQIPGEIGHEIVDHIVSLGRA